MKKVKKSKNIKNCENKFSKRSKSLTVYPLRYRYSKIEREESRMNPNERRKLIIERLSYRRKDTIPNLVKEFSVSRSTIKRDITILLEDYPIISTHGKGGGVSLPVGYYITESHLTPKQAYALRKCLAVVSPELRPILESILTDFAW